MPRKNPDPLIQVNLRLDEELLRAVELRRAQVGLTRSEWLRRALVWALAQPVTETTVRTVERT